MVGVSESRGEPGYPAGSLAQQTWRRARLGKGLGAPFLTSCFLSVGILGLIILTLSLPFSGGGGVPQPGLQRTGF